MVKFKLLFSALVCTVRLVEAGPPLFQSGSFDISTPVGLVNYVEIKGDRSLKPRSKLLDKFHAVIKANEPCNLRAQSNIILVCKNFDDGLAADPAVKNVERVYAVRKAVCETVAAKHEVPSECRKFLPDQSNGMSQQSLLRSELELANSADLDLCFRALTQLNHFWISVSNNLGDANEVCNVLRSDVELRHIIQNYRDFVSDFESLRELLQSMHGQHALWLQDSFEMAQALHDLQAETFDSFQRQFQNVSAQVFDGLDSLESDIMSRKYQIHQLSDRAMKALVAFGEETDSINDGLSRMKSSISDLYSEAALQSTSLVGQHMDQINSLLVSLAQEIDSLDTDFDNVNKQLDQWTQMSDDVVQLQIQQLVNAQQQLSVSELTLGQQYKHYELVNLTHESLQELYNKTQQIKDRYEVYIAIATFLHDYAYPIATVIIYAILSVLLAPFEKNVIGRSISAIIKATYCLGQISILAFGYIRHCVEKVDLKAFTFTAGVPLFVALLLTGCVFTLVYYLRLERKKLKTDIEKTQPVQREKSYAAVRMSDRQRHRLADISRSVRGGTTPPGL